jgi:hypothetical protein
MAGQTQDARVLAKPKMVTEYHSQISEFFHDLDKLSNIVQPNLQNFTRFGQTIRYYAAKSLKFYMIWTSYLISFVHFSPKTEFPTKSLSFQHIKTSIQQLLRPNVSAHPLAAHIVSILRFVH